MYYAAAAKRKFEHAPADPSEAAARLLDGTGDHAAAEEVRRAKRYRTANGPSDGTVGDITGEPIVRPQRNPYMPKQIVPLPPRIDGPSVPRIGPDTIPVPEVPAEPVGPDPAPEAPEVPASIPARVPSEEDIIKTQKDFQDAAMEIRQQWIDDIEETRLMWHFRDKFYQLWDLPSRQRFDDYISKKMGADTVVLHKTLYSNPDQPFINWFNRMIQGPEVLGTLRELSAEGDYDKVRKFLDEREHYISMETEQRDLLQNERYALPIWGGQWSSGFGPYSGRGYKDYKTEYGRDYRYKFLQTAAKSDISGDKWEAYTYALKLPNGRIKYVSPSDGSNWRIEDYQLWAAEANSKHNLPLFALENYHAHALGKDPDADRVFIDWLFPLHRKPVDVLTEGYVKGVGLGTGLYNTIVHFDDPNSIWHDVITNVIAAGVFNIGGKVIGKIGEGIIAAQTEHAGEEAVKTVIKDLFETEGGIEMREIVRKKGRDMAMKDMERSLMKPGKAIAKDVFEAAEGMEMQELIGKETKELLEKRYETTIAERKFKGPKPTFDEWFQSIVKTTKTAAQEEAERIKFDMELSVFEKTQGFDVQLAKIQAAREKERLANLAIVMADEISGAPMQSALQAVKPMEISMKQADFMLFKEHLRLGKKGARMLPREIEEALLQMGKENWHALENLSFEDYIDVFYNKGADGFLVPKSRFQRMQAFQELKGTFLPTEWKAPALPKREMKDVILPVDTEPPWQPMMEPDLHELKPMRKLFRDPVPEFGPIIRDHGLEMPQVPIQHITWSDAALAEDLNYLRHYEPNDFREFNYREGMKRIRENAKYLANMQGQTEARYIQAEREVLMEKLGFTLKEQVQKEAKSIAKKAAVSSKVRDHHALAESIDFMKSFPKDGQRLIPLEQLTTARRAYNQVQSELITASQELKANQLLGNAAKISESKRMIAVLENLQEKFTWDYYFSDALEEKYGSLYGEKVEEYASRIERKAMRQIEKQAKERAFDIEMQDIEAGPSTFDRIKSAARLPKRILEGYRMVRDPTRIRTLIAGGLEDYLRGAMETTVSTFWN